MLSLLSIEERQYLQKYPAAPNSIVYPFCWICASEHVDDRHNALLTSLYATAFTNGFPSHLQNFNDSRNEEMIEKPDMDKAVFCRVIRTPRDGGDITFAKYSLRLPNLPLHPLPRPSLGHVFPPFRPPTSLE